MVSKADREEIAKTRLLRVLAKHGIATARTLEQKISDAGPNNQRIDPHVLIPVRNELVKEGSLARQPIGNTPWFSVANAPPDFVKARLAEQLPTYNAFTNGVFATRMGQALEIATYRALMGTDAEFFGRFKNLDEHDDSTLYQKEEPPQHLGKLALSGDERLDFIVRHPDGFNLGLECKNVREWLYPNREEVPATLAKCLSLNCIPVFIARRIPYVTFMLLSTCGVIVHQTYNQLVPQADAALANQARHKNLLGYHDLKVGNAPDARLIKFIQTNMFAAAPEAKERLAKYRDILENFAFGEYKYHEFAARVRRRSNGQKEDNDWPEEEDQEDDH